MYVKLGLFIIVSVILPLIYLPMLIILYPRRKAVGPWLMQFYSRLCLKIFRVSIVNADKIDAKKRKNFILISNHVNFLDVFLLSALYRTVFVSKEEIKYYPLVGQVAWLVGIIFLKRNSLWDRYKIIRTVANGSRDRIVTIFPQGTTSSISDALPFNSGIFKTIEINRDIAIFPVTIHYKEDSEIAWTKEPFYENVKKVCSQKSIRSKVKVHNPITIADYNGSSIKEICDMAEKKVLTKLWDETT